MHSGNVGYAQNLDVLVRSATFLRDLDGLRIIVGFGARHGEIVGLAERLDVVDRVKFLPYQPRELLPLSLSAADVHFVGLVQGLSGYVVPSRLYGIMATGRPVIVSAEGERDGPVGRAGRLRRGHSAGAAGARRRDDPRHARRALRPRGHGRARPCVRRGGRDTHVALGRYRELLRELA